MLHELERETPERLQRLTQLVRDVFAHSNSGHRLVAIGVCAALLRDEETVQAVRARLAEDEFTTAGVAFPRRVPGSPGFCYSPLVVAWQFLQAKLEKAEFRLPAELFDPVEISRPLQLGVLKNGRLVDPQSREILRSLIDNWLVLHTAPCPGDSQYKLGKENYRALIAPLEKLWLDAFRTIQHRKQRPLVRLRPWPAPYKSALSLRYDVDRPVSQGRIAELIDIQRRFANAPCATWYYFADDANRQTHTRELCLVWQEIGLHLKKAGEALPGLGVTHHSSPISDYWRGDASNVMLDQQGTAYGEFLASQTPQLRVPPGSPIPKGQAISAGSGRRRSISLLKAPPTIGRWIISTNCSMNSGG